LPGYAARKCRAPERFALENRYPYAKRADGIGSRPSYAFVAAIERSTRQLRRCRQRNVAMNISKSKNNQIPDMD
jgi:hypothetical protein